MFALTIEHALIKQNYMNKKVRSTFTLAQEIRVTMKKTLIRFDEYLQKFNS